MAQTPSNIAFVCESCQRPAKARQVRRSLGQCPRCRGESWKLVVKYTDVDVALTAFGWATLITLGFAWNRVNKTSNQMAVDGVSAEVAAVLTENRSLVASRVVEYVRLRDQQSLRARGGQLCQVCEVLYVPADDKPWMQQGCCSKSCAAKAGWNASPNEERPNQRRASSPTIAVVCPQGHEFEVLATFSGCVRPCLSCGAKTRVP
jgi:hypothetical protein